MSDLISKKALIEKMKLFCRGNCRVCIYRKFLTNNEHCGLIDEVPTVDAVEVVRCKDCKYNGRRRCAMSSEGDSWNNDNDYCSWGAKMDGGDKE